jgi:hypothetical protein
VTVSCLLQDVAVGNKEYPGERTRLRMPHLHDEKKADNDDASHVSECSKSVGERSCTSAAAESAANKLLSLAQMAEEHSKVNTDPGKSKEGGDESVDATANRHPTSPSPNTMRPPFDTCRQATLRPGMGPRWGMVGVPPHIPRDMGPLGGAMHGFFGQGAMRPMYPPGAPMKATSPDASPGGFIRRGGRGGFPMWTTPPRPPYHPHAQGRSPLPTAYRGPVSPPYMNHSSPSYEEEQNANGKRSPPKRVSMERGKSILKKPKRESSPTAEVAVKSVAEEKQGLTKKTASDDVSPQPSIACSSTGGAAKNEATIESVVVDKSSLSSDDLATKKQRIISPASSNECPKSVEDDEETYGGNDGLSPQQQNRNPIGPVSSRSPTHHPHRGAPFRMGHLHPVGPGIHPNARRPGGQFLQQPPLYPPHHGMRPYPVGMHGMGAPAMFPLPHHRSMSARGRPGFPPAMPPFFARARMEATPSPTQQASQRPSSSPGVAEKDQPTQSIPASPVGNGSTCQSPVKSTLNMEPVGDGTMNTKRCIPLNPPIPSKYFRYVVLA